MKEPIPIDRATARRFLVVRHLLAPPRSLPAGPDSVMTVVDRLGSLQFDPLEVAGRNHDLVLLSRVRDYRRAMTDGLLYDERRLYETNNKGLSLVPTAELPWFRVTWDSNKAEHDGSAFDAHAPLVEELLDRIRRDGPLSSTDVEPRAVIDWYWRPTNQVRAILEALGEAGVLGLRRRDGNRRVYDLAERLFPAELLERREPERDQRRHKLLSRYRGHGLLGRSGSSELWYGTAPVKRPAGRNGDGPTRPQLLAELIERGDLSPVAVDGVRGERYAITAELPILADAKRAVAAERADAAARPDGAERSDGAESAAGADDTAWTVGRPGDIEPGVAFLAPLDPYVWDRDFLRALHGFDYVWEVYVPQKKRRWGYYVLPILFGDRLVGRIEPRIERKTGTLRVLGLWWETGFDPLAAPGFVAAFGEALEAHRRFGGMARIALPRTHAHRPFVAALRERRPMEERP
ncbi:MAG: DNA glycosylase AlkZ-like family protein [Candidatus Limnocylindrales bacterium]